MRYYLLTFGKLPKIEFAHGYDTANYSLSFNSFDLCELAYVERGDVEFSDASGKYLIPEGSLWFLDHHAAGRTRCPTGSHSHFTVIFSGVEVKEIGEDEIESAMSLGNSAAVPMFVPEMKSSEITKTIKNTVKLWATPSLWRDTVGVGYLLSALGGLSKITAESLGKKETGSTESLIAYRAKGYIAAHIAENISVSDIASHLEISAAYLSRSFKKTENCTVIDYINRKKVDKIREMLSDRGISLSQAGEALGFGDSNYTSRLFRKYVGMSFREYSALHNNHQ